MPRATAALKVVAALNPEKFNERNLSRLQRRLRSKRQRRYELLRELGRGGFGVVYEAKHLKRSDRVALKTIPSEKIGENASADAERLHKFRREFRALAEINHPNLVGMQSLEVDGNQWFFTMDFVDGVDVLSYVRPNGELDESRLRSALRQLASGIMALHAQHVIHRDLKPLNVMVDGEGRVVILDFGLVVEISRRLLDVTASMDSAHFAGTIPYAAPEQFSGHQTPASDWYACGVMMYEALCGVRPFQGTAADIIAQKQRNNPTPACDQSDVPKDLAELTDALIMPDPSQRPDALGIARALSVERLSNEGKTRDNQATSTSDSTGTLLIGREQQLADLSRIASQVRDRKSVV